MIVTTAKVVNVLIVPATFSASGGTAYSGAVCSA